MRTKTWRRSSVGVEVVGRRSVTEVVGSSVGGGGEVVPIPSLQRLF
jgi:hypothetical protein